MFAKTKEVAAALSRQVQSKAADKYYYAMTDGVPEESCGVLEDELLHDGKTNTTRVVSTGTKGAKHARLSYEVSESNGEQAILRVQLDTGRRHQIRVQLANAGYPIVGDRKYNPKESGRETGLKLCSYKIGFSNPMTKKKMEFEIQNPYQL